MENPTLVMYTTAYAVAAGLGLWWVVFTLFFAFTGSFRPRRRKTSR